MHPLLRRKPKSAAACSVIRMYRSLSRLTVDARCGFMVGVMSKGTKKQLAAAAKEWVTAYQVRMRGRIRLQGSV